MIRSYANELEDNGMPLNMICDHVTKALKEYNISPQYVRKCLEEKYKDPDQSGRASSGATSSADSLEQRLEIVKKDLDKVFDVDQKEGLSVENIIEKIEETVGDVPLTFTKIDSLDHGLGRLRSSEYVRLSVMMEPMSQYIINST